MNRPDRAMTTSAFTVRENVSSTGPSAVRIPTSYYYRHDGEKKFDPVRRARLPTPETISV